MPNSDTMRLLFESVESANLSDLALVSPIFERLQDDKLMQRRERTPEDTLLEYDNAKWGKLLDFVSNFPGAPSIDVLDRHFLGEEQVVFCFENELYKGTAYSARRIGNQVVFDYLDAIPEFETLVEVGAGYGSVLIGYQEHGLKSNLLNKFIGTDFSEAALSIMKTAGQRSKTDVIRHDFSSSERLPVLEDAVIISHMALVMIPELSHFVLDTLLAANPQLVIHFETMWEDFARDTLGDLQKKYTEQCAYNLNLQSILFDYERDGRIEIVDHIPTFYGENCLLPTSIISWKPRLRSS